MTKLRVVVNAADVTWDKVRERHERALQMGEQTVEAFADIGEMLIALKNPKVTPHGEFQQRCLEALGKKDNGIISLNAATQMARLYMRVANNRAAWEQWHPASLNEALKLISPPRKKPKAFRVGWAAYLADRLGGDQREYSAIANGKRKNELVVLAGFPAHGENKGFLTSAEQAKTFGDAYVRHFAPEIERPPLDPKAGRTVQRAIDAETSKIYRELNAFVAGKVHEETAAQRVEMNKRIEEADDTVRSYNVAIKKINDFMTLDEYRLVLNCLHPDRAPENRRARFAEAFAVMKRLDKYF